MDDSASSNRLGKIQQGSIELSGATVGKCLVKLLLILPIACQQQMYSTLMTLIPLDEKRLFRLF